MKKICIVTRDCAGVNTAIRAVVRSAYAYNIEVMGALKGYNGLMDDDVVSLNRRSVSGIINLGGTILKTARALRFHNEEGKKQAVATIKKHHIDGLAVIGGNGTLTGAHILASRFGIPVVAIPATIDNDINGIELSLGADTAVNVALDAIDKIRDTATSLERIFVIEVMGRNCGYIALQVALAGGCEEVILPEKEYNIEIMCDEIMEGNKKGKVSWIIIVAEGKAKARDIALQITERTHLETREVVLGHIQRGGRPTAYDRILASELGNYAVELIRGGSSDICVGRRNDELMYIPLEEAVKPKDIKVDNYYRLIKILT